MAQHIPVIDVAPLDHEGAEGGAAVVAAIGRACRDVGFFIVVNHGVDAVLIGGAFEQSRRFFSLPLIKKQALAIEKVGGNRGYSGLMHEALDPTRGADMKEAFNIGLDLDPGDPEISGHAPSRGLNVWPGEPRFKSTLLAYFDACRALGATLHRALAADLGLSKDFFVDKFTRPMATLHLLHYPASVDASGPAIGAGEHTDYGNLTLLATDAVGGLEVRTRAGAWIAAPVMPGALIVNIGDCLMRWTNDIYVSTPHRVINRGGAERYSIAFFLDPNPDALVAAIPGCVATGQSPRYAPILAADHLKARLDASKPKGIA